MPTEVEFYSATIDCKTKRISAMQADYDENKLQYNKLNFACL
jgi:hypothetical protein